MTIEEYFGDWSGVIDLQEADKTMRKLAASREFICPNIKDVFKAFRLCSFNNVKCIIIGQDCYPNYRNGKPVATGLAFANSSDTSEENYSPSLKVLTDSLINFSLTHDSVNFDPTLEKWEEQGVLLLNSALSCLKGKPNSHLLLWRPFITDFLTTLSMCKSNLVYVLMGSQAQSLELFLDNRHNKIIKCRHPAYYARTKTKMPSYIWLEINEALRGYGNPEIKWI